VSKKNALLIELQYLPAIAWFQEVIQYDTIFLDCKEHFVKGSYRNRCYILGANGPQRLSIPLVKGKHQQTAMEDVLICNDINWQKIHWQALRSAYKKSPFFEFYEDLFYPFYHRRFENLFAYNLQLLHLLFSILRLKKEIVLTANYIHPGTNGFADFRSVISPKKETPQHISLPVYTQVFSDRFQFYENLSIIDFICNSGNALA